MMDDNAEVRICIQCLWVKCYRLSVDRARKVVLRNGIVQFYCMGYMPVPTGDLMAIEIWTGNLVWQFSSEIWTGRIHGMANCGGRNYRYGDAKRRVKCRTPMTSFLCGSLPRRLRIIIARVEAYYIWATDARKFSSGTARTFCGQVSVMRSDFREITVSDRHSTTRCSDGSERKSFTCM